MAEAPRPFRRELTATAQEQIRESSHWLLTFSEDTAGRFLDVLEAELAALSQRLGAGFRPLPDESASLFFSRPLFQHVFRTGVKQRGNVGAWRIYYEMRDTDGDGEPDVVRIITVRHAAARPLSLSEQEPQEE